MKKIGNYWVDSRNNKWDAKISFKRAQKLSKSLDDCRNCINCNGCVNCYDCNNCIDCFDCNNCINCRYGCSNCTNCKWCNGCRYCINCKYCYDCNSRKYFLYNKNAIHQQKKKNIKKKYLKLFQIKNKKILFIRHDEESYEYDDAWHADDIILDIDKKHVGLLNLYVPYYEDGSIENLDKDKEDFVGFHKCEDEEEKNSLIDIFENYLHKEHLNEEIKVYDKKEIFDLLKKGETKNENSKN